MEYIIDVYTANSKNTAESTEFTIEFRAARIVGLKRLENQGNIDVRVYSDFGLNSIQREYKKTVRMLLESHINDGIYSMYNYTDEYLKSVKENLKNIKQNPRKA